MLDERDWERASKGRVGRRQRSGRALAVTVAQRAETISRESCSTLRSLTTVRTKAWSVCLRVYTRGLHLGCPQMSALTAFACIGTGST